MKLKVQPGHATLCAKCDESQIAMFDNGSVVVICNYGIKPLRVHRPIVQCSQFRDKHATSKYDMEKIAWTLNTNPNGKVLGFTPPVKKAED